MSNASKAREKAHAARMPRAEWGEPLVRRDPLEKPRRKPTSLRLAVNAKCADCVGWHGDPGPRKRIRDCTSTLCPLHAVRPYQKGSEEAAEAEDEVENVAVRNVIREGGNTLFALLMDDRILRGTFASDEEAEAALQAFMDSPVGSERLLADGWEEMADGQET
jgi:hypothetical protein